VTDAWMQHPVGYTRAADGSFQVASFWQILTNPWALLQYSHNMSGAVITGSFVMAAVGAFYLLERKHEEQARIFVGVGVVAGVIFSCIQVFPTGDLHGKYMAKHQPATTAAMEGLWKTERGAGLTIMGQPDVEKQRIDNPLVVNKMLSFLIYGTTVAEVQGLDKVPREDWPTNIPLLYYSYHIMAGLGTAFIAIMLAAVFLLWRKKLFTSRWMLWILMLALPFPYIANTAGWMTAEIGRQPWLVFGLLRTQHGFSANVSAGNGLFTLMGFMGMYTVLAILFLFLISRVIARGPVLEESIAKGTPVSAV
jgi:cytochrome d ubiquinol oxidase subunit I